MDLQGEKSAFHLMGGFLNMQLLYYCGYPASGKAAATTGSLVLL